MKAKFKTRTNVINTVMTTLALTVFTQFSANALELTSEDIQEGHPMAKTFEFSQWGCSGENLSPQLMWKDVPQDTKSFAITVYDPDAPTESGFWHWVAVDIPVNTTELPRGVELEKLGAREFSNDYGDSKFGGACPPKGDGMHRYQFTIWALPTEKLKVPDSVSPAVVGFNLNAIALEKATITTTYTR